ncbi:hypothetical protein [Ralstonia sp. Ralssp135]|uniref:hypothetical protein n=1 Tax=Ralstonia sp. Ralssp135 TaxID=3243016 RepID=UPI0039B00BF5
MTEDHGFSRIQPCDSLRAIDTLCEPDPRSAGRGLVDEAGNVRAIELLDHLESVTQLSLSEDVPDTVRVHFDTARNVLVYTWFVYRFYAVAEQQALTSLEFALRERLESGRFATPAPLSRKLRGLSDRLAEARKQGLIDSATLPRAADWALERARHRFQLEQVDRMTRLGLCSLEVDDSRVQPSPEDLQHDWIETFILYLPKVRNMYAHGTETLHPGVLRTFEIVRDLIGQLFSK